MPVFLTLILFAFQNCQKLQGTDPSGTSGAANLDSNGNGDGYQGHPDVLILTCVSDSFDGHFGSNQVDKITIGYTNPNPLILSPIVKPNVMAVYISTGDQIRFSKSTSGSNLNYTQSAGSDLYQVQIDSRQEVSLEVNENLEGTLSFSLLDGSESLSEENIRVRCHAPE